MQDLRQLVATLSAVNFVVGMGAFVIVGVLEPVASDLELRPEEAGAFLTVYALSYAVLSPILVSITGRLGRRRVLFWSLATFTVAAALSAVAVNATMLHAARILAALGAGALTPVGAAVIAALVPEAERGKQLAAVFFGLTLAQVIGVPAGTWIGYAVGWRWAFAIVALLAVPCLWLIWTRVPTGLKFQPVSLADLARVLRDPGMMLALSFTMLFLAGIYVLYTYLAPILSTLMGFGATGITAFLFVFGIGAVIGNLFGGWLTDRIGPNRTLTLLVAVQVCLMPVFALLPFSIVLLFALAVIWPIFGWSFMSAQQARLVGRDPARAPVSLALNAAAIYVGAAAGSAIGGLVISGYGLAALGPAAALLTATALISLWGAR